MPIPDVYYFGMCMVTAAIATIDVHVATSLAQEQDLLEEWQDIPIRYPEKKDSYDRSAVGESDTSAIFTSNDPLGQDALAENGSSDWSKFQHNRRRRDALSNGDYEEYYRDGDAEAQGLPRPRRPTTEEITTSIEWQVQLFLLLAVVIKITCWVWLYCLMYPLAECSGYWLDRCRRRDPRYRIVKQVASTMNYDMPSYKVWLPIVHEYDGARTTKFDVIDFVRFMHCNIIARSDENTSKGTSANEIA